MQYLVQQTIDFLQKTTQKADFDKKNFENFIKIFYSEAQDYDFANYSAQDLYNAAKLSFEFLANKKTDEFKVRIYNPTLKKDGFESPYTFLDIVNNDMPFLVDSTVAYLDKYGIRVKNSIHPIYSVIRDKNGKLLEISAARNSGQESVIQLHFHKIVSGYNTKMLQENIEKILRNTALIFEDSQAMIQLLQKASLQIDNAKRISDRTKEIQEFLAWIADNNFILLGAVEFDICQIKKGEFSLKEAKNSSFGVFRSADQEFRPQVINSSFEEVGNSVSNPYLIEFVKSRYRSLIHKITNAERIRVQKIAPDGKVIGEFRFIGLFTSAAHHQNVNSIPLIRSIIAKVIADSGYIEGSHNYKDLISVLESYPRDELFQISPEDLLKNATGIVGICGRSQVKFFARKDKFNRFVSCLVFTPRDYSNSELRDKIKNHLSKVYNGEITDSFLQITDSNLIRFHIIICTDKGIPDFDEAEIERQLVKITTVWSDDLFGAMKAKFCDEKHISLFTRYKNAFSVSYINRFDPKRAAIDISRIEECSKTNLVLFNLYKSSDSLPEDISELKIFSPEKELVLSSIMPVLESFGFNVIQEHTYVVSPIKNEMDESSKKVWIHYFHLNLSRMGHKFSEKIKLNFEKTIALIWSEVMVISFLNRLVIVADLNWKQVYMLGAYTRYLYQAGFRYSENYIADILVRYSDLTKLLAKLFEIKFDPFPKIDPKQRQDKIKEIVAQINQDLNQVKDVADDQVIRRFFSVITATLRTNYYQHCRDKKGFKGYISFKFDCKKVPNLPLPLPHTEAFVYSARFEAIHLRGGKVARGGLRWSDRQEDFRTEVLGLMKAQMTKNALIVPVGSKGGFVLKRNLSCMTRDEIQKEAIECYQTFLSGLLDITDNVVDGKIEHPQNVIMHDESDPYLVVAADKGTATFSDIANQISANYHFWLGDAFASGGSFGYDHKKMGITARGAWISVMRHFREMKIDTQSQNFTCIGIGDMAGDVFGNGMLLSRHIKLVAAFNHLHIFLDPNPDTQKSFFERKRLFDLPQSSWTDYSQSLISKGGGVFTRSVKSIKISPEIKKVLAIKEHELSPDDLIKNILKAPVDLLWNGGIGTYVKSCDESEQEVSDRSNDLTRVNGNELRCKVVGEGGNLGFTQKGRIEYALNGGRINTDFIDNSAGVDCSDHEVNIKIALTAALRNKKITFEERNQILESMTEEVANLVLKDNNLQTHAISVAALQGIALIDDQAQFLDKLEKSGLLNRKIEFLPSKKEIDKRQNDRIGLTRPEICTMLAYSKIEIYNQLVVSDLVKDEYFEHELFSYFPKIMQKRFCDEIFGHQLKKEIIATQITNFVVNKVGITFVNQICQDTGFSLVDVIKSLIIACDAFRLRQTWEEIENLDGKITPDIQIQMFLSPRKLLERSVMWLVRDKSKGSLKSIVQSLKKINDELFAIISEVLSKDSRESFERKIEKYDFGNLSYGLANKIAAMDPIASAFEISEISAASNFDLKTIAKIYFAVGTRFSLKWLRSKVKKLSLENYWEKVSTKIILEEIYYYQMQIAKRVVAFSCWDKGLCEINSLDKWIKNTGSLVERFDSFIFDLKSKPNPDLAIFIVALNRLKLLLTSDLQ